MSTSSTIEVPRIVCPDWCERTDHHADLVDADNPPMHYGPEFSDGPVLVTVQGRDGGPLEAGIHADGDVFISDPLKLRDLAVELVRAAKWMEARR